MRNKIKQKKNKRNIFAIYSFLITQHTNIEGLGWKPTIVHCLILTLRKLKCPKVKLKCLNKLEAKNRMRNIVLCKIERYRKIIYLNMYFCRLFEMFKLISEYAIFNKIYLSMNRLLTCVHLISIFIQVFILFILIHKHINKSIQFFFVIII